MRERSHLILTERMGIACFSVLLLALVDMGFAHSSQKLSRDDFPSSFVFGAGTSAYQVEGAVAEDGRSPGIWDYCAHSGGIIQENADVTADHYHKYKEDVKLMGDMGLDVYRMSISWSRILPNGRGAVNPKGLEFYNNLLDELTKHGIQPQVTLHHVDHPQILEDEYGGWLSPKMVDDFTAFADVCFREFGDRVPHWTTINEPNVNSLGAYDLGFLPPQRCSNPFGINCRVGNSTIEPYIVVHHILLAHASVVTLYKEKYLAKQQGFVGLNVYGIWFAPMTDSPLDVAAAQRALDFYNGWIIDPLVFGDYPESMKKIVGSRLPAFTKSQSKALKGSFDFIGLNHYITTYVADSPSDSKPKPRDFNMDMSVLFSSTKDGTPSSQVIPPLVPNAAWGLQSLLENLKQKYGNPPIYVQENGLGQPRNETLNDSARVDYITGYLNATLNAIKNGSDTRGYIVWSFMDVYELLSGYQSRFGLYHVDFDDKNFKRTPKFSAHWFTHFLKRDKKTDVRRARSDGGLRGEH